MKKLFLPACLLIMSLSSCKKGDESPSGMFIGHTYETYIGMRAGEEIYHHIKFATSTDAILSINGKNGNLIESKTVPYSFGGTFLDIDGNKGTPAEALIIVENKTLVPGAPTELNYILIE